MLCIAVLCGCFPLATYFTFGSVYMFMPLSHFVLAYPSPSPRPQVHSLHLRLYSCPAPRFFRTFFFLIPYIYHNFLIQSSVDGQRHVHVVTIVNSATMNIGVHVSFQINVFIFSDIYPGVGSLDHMVTLFLVFKEPPYCFP